MSLFYPVFAVLAMNMWLEISLQWWLPRMPVV